MLSIRIWYAICYFATMKKGILYLILFFNAQLFAQKNDTLQLHLVKFPNGKISAYSYLLKSTDTGKAYAYKANGELLFEYEISRLHGHTSVYFEHHENKTVSKIEISSAPDGGIQWYRSFLYYDENGNFLRKDTDSHDKTTILYQEPIKEEVVVCSTIYQNETYFINQTKDKLAVSYSARGELKTEILGSKDTLLMGSLIQAQFFQNPDKEAKFNATSIRKNKNKYIYTFQLINVIEINKTTRRYFYGIKKGKV